VSAELQTGVAYALLAGILWGLTPLLLKRAIKHTNVSNATLVEQHVAVALLAGLAAHKGEISAVDFTGQAFWAFFWPAPSAPALARSSTTGASIKSAHPKLLRLKIARRF
jgi:uncharacterized membrane protein